MKKLLALFLVLAAATVTYAQRPMKVTYKPLENYDIFAMLDFQDVQFMKVELVGELTGKSYSIKMYTNKRGFVSEKEVTQKCSFTKDTLTLSFMSKQLNADSVKIGIYESGLSFRATEIVTIATKDHILMEAQLNPALYMNIGHYPLFAYTDGLRKTSLYNEIEYKSVDYCGLRDAKKHPGLWYKDLGIEEYVWFEIDIK